MKKSLIVFIVAGLVLLATGIWFFTSMNEFTPMDLLQYGVIILIVAFAIFVGVKKLRNVKRGEPAEDELSKKILQKTAAISYYVSLYIWVFLLSFKDRIKWDTDELIGAGILAMAVTFGISWVIINFKGIKND
jgi:peptidoglycan/LPS O-acetylase OafA/YrhL